MFYSIRGVVTHTGPGIIRLLAGPIEWEVEASGSTLRTVLTGSAEVRLFTYLHHREDVLSLFGFATEDERSLFLELIKVSGIGPKQAIRMLSGAAPQSIQAAIASADVDGLARIPGIGKKTAAKIVLALQNRLEAPVGAGAVSTGLTEIVDGLVQMGFDRAKTLQAVRAAAASFDGNDTQEGEIFRAALVSLSQGG